MHISEMTVSEQWINLIFFLNFAVTIVLNHGQNDEK